MCSVARTHSLTEVQACQSKHAAGANGRHESSCIPHERSSNKNVCMRFNQSMQAPMHIIVSVRILLHKPNPRATHVAELQRSCFSSLGTNGCCSFTALDRAVRFRPRRRSLLWRPLSLSLAQPRGSSCRRFACREFRRLAALACRESR